MIGDSGVSELTGYAVIIGTVMLAIIGLSAAGTGPLTASMEHIKMENAGYSIQCLSSLISRAVSTNNSCMITYETCIPEGYGLKLKDGSDDVTSINVTAGSSLIAPVRPGSVSISSPFRSVTYEAGAAIQNDTGKYAVTDKPSIFIQGLPSGKKALYIHIISIETCDAAPLRSGPATLGVRCTSIKYYEHSKETPFETVIMIRSSNVKAWEAHLNSTGLSTSFMNGDLKASTWSVSEVHVIHSTVSIDVLR